MAAQSAIISQSTPVYKAATDFINDLENRVENLEKIQREKNLQKNTGEYSTNKNENDRLSEEILRLKDELIVAEIKNGLRQFFVPIQVVNKTVDEVKVVATPEKDVEKGVEKGQDKAAPPEGGKKKPAKKASTATKESSGGDGPIDISRLDLRIGFIESAEKHPDADSLYVEKVNVGDGEGRIRTIVSGLVKHVPLDKMQQRHAVFLCNLKPAKMRGILSEGMIMCASRPDGGLVEILEVPNGVKAGDRVYCQGFDPNIVPDQILFLHVNVVIKTTRLNPKKKIWETVQPDLRTDGEKRACYQGRPFRVVGFGDQDIRAATLADCQINSCSHSPKTDLNCSKDADNLNSLVQNQLSTAHSEIFKHLQVEHCPSLQSMAEYHFDGRGKLFRPKLVILNALAANQLVDGISSPSMLRLNPAQLRVAAVAEMIHTASLVHDDVIDEAVVRRGRSSLQAIHGQKTAVLAGSFIMARASQAIASLANPDVIMLLSQVIEDLVHGELMQLGSRKSPTAKSTVKTSGSGGSSSSSRRSGGTFLEKDPNEVNSSQVSDSAPFFQHYLEKTYLKTASLMANSFKAAAVLAGINSPTQLESFFQFGRNFGTAFQLIDDALDFVGTLKSTGKPVNVDLQHGVATAPVYFAANQFPELRQMISRRFSQLNDLPMAIEMVEKSGGVEETRILAKSFFNEAVRQLEKGLGQDQIGTLVGGELVRFSRSLLETPF